MTLKNVFIRLALVWVLLAQMFYVCLAANTTVSLSKLEAKYAFVPSPAHKNSLDNEFERVARYESQRAIAKFGGMLLIDVALIALFWNLGAKRKSAFVPTGAPANSLTGQFSVS
jgi:hypothetical protein